MAPVTGARAGSGLVGHSLIYSVAPMLRYAISFAMNRFYTSFLITALYGVRGMVDLWMILMQQMLGQNLLGGMLRFYYDHKDEEQRKRVVTSVTIVLTSAAWVVCAAMFLLSDDLAPILIGRPTADVSATQIEHAFRFLVVLVPFQLSSLSGFYFLQAQKRSKLYTGVQTAKTALEVLLHVLFMGVLGWGLNGFLLGLLLGEIVTTCCLTGWMLWTLGPRVDWQVFRPVLHYALPLIPVGIFQLGLHQLDRRLIEHVYSGKEGLSLTGIYDLGYRIGQLINPILIWPFMQIWQPTIYGVEGEEERARLVGRVTTWMVTGIGAASLAVIAGGRQAVDLIAGQVDYLPGYQVVPWVAAGYVFWSLYSSAQMPLLLAKRTLPLFWINLLGLGFCVGTNLWWIPRLGIVGAALSTTASFAFLSALVVVASRGVARVPFELGRLATVFAVVLVSCLAVRWLDRIEIYASVGTTAAVLGSKAALLAAGWVLLWRGVLQPEERAAFASEVRERLGRKGKGPSA
jgi:O-antigen/teichoic acid export membrane protein